MKAKLLSVIMSVYNGEVYIKEAMDSIINQTYKNWELIVIDDCSTDNTFQILKSYKDPRIHIIRNEENMRLASSLNRGLSLALGDYILRMDADDICRLDRFEKQLEFMEKNPHIDISFGKGFWYKDSLILKKTQNISLKPLDLKAVFLFTTPVMHNCVIAKKKFYETYTYKKEYTHSEDWNLWYRSSKDFKFAGQNEYLILYRIHESQTTTSTFKESIYVNQYKKNFTEYTKQIGFPISEKEIDFHTSLICSQEPVDPLILKKWFAILLLENKKYNYYKTSSLMYSFLWVSHGLFLTKRLTSKNLITILAYIGLGRSLIFYVYKIIYSYLDLAKQKKARKLFSF